MVVGTFSEIRHLDEQRRGRSSPGPLPLDQNPWQNLTSSIDFCSQTWFPLLAGPVTELLLFLNACKAQLLDC